MNQWMTEVKIPEFDFEINHHTKLLSMGSCFAENIADRLKRYKFNVVANPFGIIYNPASIALSLGRLLENKPFSEDDLFYHNELWKSYAHHGDYSHTDKSQALAQINADYNEAVSQLKEAELLILTFGTAWIYNLKETGQLVANCHKVPAAKFARRRLKVDEIVESIASVLQAARAVNPQLKVLFTVSPVRHFKDGLTENNLSKATLLLAVHQLVERLNYAHYFPAYELVIDELRDYRYYAEDMAHPNQQSVDYVWAKFSQCFFSTETLKLNERIEKIVRGLEHKPLHPATTAHQQFKETVSTQIEQIKAEHPYLNW